jgi:hypothetical protein
VKSSNSEKHPNIALTVAQSILQASGAWGYTVEFLKQCKLAGCPAFRGSRIYYRSLKKWLKSNGDKVTGHESRVDLEKKKIALQCRQLEYKLEVEQAQHIPREKIWDSILKIAEFQKRVLRQKLEIEYPALLAGADLAEHRKKGAQVVDEICAIFSSGSIEWKPPS